MRIGKYELENNTRVPFHVIEYLRERYEALERHLEAKYGAEFDISMNYSNQSESAYFTIQQKYVQGEFCESVEVSFRNHDNFAQSNYEKAIFLSQFETWTDCKKHFLKDVLPGIIEKLRG